MMARANRFWVGLGGSVDSGTCWSSKTLFVITPPLLASRAGFRSERSRAISRFPASVYRLFDKGCERLTFERLAEEAQRSGLKRARPHRFLGKSGHEDNRYVAALCQKQVLQFDAIQARHLQIGDQAGRIVQAL